MGFCKNQQSAVQVNHRLLVRENAIDSHEGMTTLRQKVFGRAVCELDPIISRVLVPWA